MTFCLNRIRPTRRSPLLKLLTTAICVCLFILSSNQLHAQRNLTDIPTPDPVAELAAMQVAEGFEVNLFAADPDLTKPIHMNWDAEGNLWIASSRNYPQLKPGAEPSDEIIVLKDTDGDGVADKRIVFADDMMLPTGILPGDGGVYVANSTEVIHLKDTDGDGKADNRRTILSGFGTEDTHHLLHTLRWRPDGRMAMNQSIYIHSHIETPYGVKHLDGGGIWHFDPLTSELEVFCKGFVNPWGHAIDPFGQSLVTDGAYFEGINYTFPGAVFATSPGATRVLSGLNPGSPKHCGLEMISGAAMPEDMQGVLVTNDFRGHRVCRFRIEKAGAGFRSVQLPELIRSEHIAFRPIDVKMGPDGAIYIADWYNPIIQHGEVDFRDPRRDTEHGRIWRISAKDKKPLQTPNYAGATEAELAGMTVDSAGWVRQFARQELATREPTKVDAALTALPGQLDGLAKAPNSTLSSDAKQLAVLQPMWEQLAQHRIAPETLDSLRRHEDARVRAAAVRVIGEQASGIPPAAGWLLLAVQDSDDQVALEAICGLDRLGSLEAVRGILRASGREAKDQYLNFAIWTALRDNESVWLPAFESGKLQVDDFAALDALADAATTPVVARLLAERIAAQPAERQARTAQLIASRGDAQSLSTLAKWIVNSEQPIDVKSALLSMLTLETKARNVKPAEANALLSAAIAAAADVNESNTIWVTSLADAAGEWATLGAVDGLTKWLKTGIAKDNSSVVQASCNALAMIGTAKQNASKPAADSATQMIRGLASGSMSDLDGMDIEAQAAAISALSSFAVSSAADELIKLILASSADELSSGVQLAVGSVLSRKGGTDALNKSIAANRNATWEPNQARQLVAMVRGSAQSNDALVASIVKATGLENAGWKLSEELSGSLIALASSEGDPAKGEQIYRRAKLQCVSCHAIGQSGIAIGPNLVSLGGSSTPDYIVESLLEPSAKVKEGFQTLSILLDTDEIINGLQKSKTPEAVQLMLADGKIQTISTDSIVAIREGNSLMPAGLVDDLSKGELVDLVAFLSQLGKSPEYTVDTKTWVRNWETLIYSSEANGRMYRTSLDTAATNDPAMKWRYVSTQVNAGVPIAELDVFKTHRQVPETVFLRFTLECEQPGDIQLKFNHPTGAIAYWIDSLPKPTPQPEQSIALEAGTHTFVISVRPAEVGDVIACEIVLPTENAAVVNVP